MAAIKQLAGQTLWYGISSIGAKFLNYLLTPLLTYLMHDAAGVQDYGAYSLFYSWIAVANILFTYGFETGYFRFSNKEGIDRSALFQTSFGSLLISTIGLVFLFSFFSVPINQFINPGGPSKYVIWCLLLVGLDTLSAIPFARLRQENRPRKYAFVKLAGIVINILLTVLFLVYLPRYTASHPGSGLTQWYTGNNRVGFLLMANILQNLFVFLILFPEWKAFRFRINTRLWKQVFAYSAPMIVIGLAGMINEVMDRQMLARFLPLPPAAAKSIVGIYSANYKLAIFITLFIQAFKMAAEPFFFNQAKEKTAPVLYARVMKWFIITLCLAFLFSALYLDIWKYFIGTAYRSGLGVVPVLLFANICLGIYYNLSVWYKLTDRMRMGLYITVMGAVITLLGNYWFIPRWGMYAAAWTTLVCYATMVVVTYFIGQKYFPVPYPVKKLLAYLTVMLLLFFFKTGVNAITAGLSELPQLCIRFIAATAGMLLFLLLVLKVEKAELKAMPFIGKFIK
ncbi:lipopolysaccharide biosynthesis protein [Taibaiella koreensis]|uniref:lipopolysaccharide biosynthesis protein n=1 Tax=Taibaiella koreensis TaxID=1268548 RepID=UPI000E59CDBD|nr:oligosaccharide flippase family protein [Taibaiella koreensis]